MINGWNYTEKTIEPKFDSQEGENFSDDLPHSWLIISDRSRCPLAEPPVKTNISLKLLLIKRMVNSVAGWMGHLGLTISASKTEVIGFRAVWAIKPPRGKYVTIHGSGSGWERRWLASGWRWTAEWRIFDTSGALRRRPWVSCRSPEDYTKPGAAQTSVFRLDDICVWSTDMVGQTRSGIARGPSIRRSETELKEWLRLATALCLARSRRRLPP